MIKKISGGTGLLWHTFIDIKQKLDQTQSDEVLEESVLNEKTILVLAIVASVITVSYFDLIYRLYRKNILFIDFT